MRATRRLLVAILVAVAALGSGYLGSNATEACAAHFSCVGVRLPAPITITTDHGGLPFIGFRIGRDGRVRRIPNPWGWFPRDAAIQISGNWFMFRRGHLVVGRGKRPLWRSHEEIKSSDQIGVIIANLHMVAFQHQHKLYLARLRSAERPVANREMPLGWTNGGLFTYRYQGRRLLLRSDAGRVLKVIARQPLGSDYFVANGSLYYITHGTLMSARGARTRRLASVARLGISADPWLQPVGRLLELEDNSRLVVLRPNGSVFAWTPLRESRAGGVSSSLVVAPRASSVAFTATSGQTYGTETVYVLRAGAHTATPVHREPVQLAACARGASLQWHGEWLLYSNTESNIAVIDTTGIPHTIGLTSRIRRLPGTRNGFSAYWSEQVPEP